MRVAATLLCLVASAAQAELAPEILGRSERVARPEPHWTFYLDFQLANFQGRYVLIDGDDVEYLAHLSAGQFPSLAIAPDASEVYVAETTYAYGSRGERHDFVTVYDTTDYAAQDHITLPTGRRALMASRQRMTLLGDPRFLAIYNYRPATSVSLVDLKSRVHLSETPVPGCHLLYATGPRGVSMLCGDGSMLTLRFDEHGALAGQERGEPFFDPDADPIKTNAARIGQSWYFVSYAGDVYPVDAAGERPVFGEPWALVDHDVEEAGWIRALLSGGKAGPWKPGGMQLAAGHTGRKELYVLMHPTFWSGGLGDHDFPGAEVWVFDVARRERLRVIELRGVGTSLNVSPDAEPLLFVAGVELDTEEQGLEIYDAQSGEFLREMHEYGDAILGFRPFPAAAFAGEER